MGSQWWKHHRRYAGAPSITGVCAERSSNAARACTGGNGLRHFRRNMERITTPPPLPPRPREGHKGLFGRVLIVGGNDGMIGAPVLAATSALRMGAGLVQIAVPRSILAQC